MEPEQIGLIIWGIGTIIGFMIVIKDNKTNEITVGDIIITLIGSIMFWWLVVWSQPVWKKKHDIRSPK